MLNKAKLPADDSHIGHCPLCGSRIIIVMCRQKRHYDGGYVAVLKCAIS